MIFELGVAVDGAAAANAKILLDFLRVTEGDVSGCNFCDQTFACCIVLVIMIWNRGKTCAAGADFEPLFNGLRN